VRTKVWVTQMTTVLEWLYCCRWKEGRRKINRRGETATVPGMRSNMVDRSGCEMIAVSRRRV